MSDLLDTHDTLDVPVLDDAAEGREPVAVPVYGTEEDLLAMRKLFQEYHPGNLLPPNVDDLLDGAEGCECMTQCIASSDCGCIEEHGLFYDMNERLLLDALPSRHPLYECSSLCACSSSCGNRKAQSGVRQQLYVARASSCGLGLFTRSPLSEGTFVCLYAGEILSRPEATDRWRTRAERGESNYILILREQLDNGSALRTIIDPTERGNVGRFMNHACPPATSVVILPIRKVGHLIPLAAAFTKRDIEAGEELTFDYADCAGLDPDGARVGAAGDGIPCLCGSERCRGWMPFDASL